MDKMVRVPLRFKENVKLSKEMKEFIGKCLEVKEEHRMSLD
jgi:hypothetical protein